MFAHLRDRQIATISLVFLLVLVLLTLSSPTAQAARVPALPTAAIPNLAWNTFLGGSGGDAAFSMVQDANGNFYISGESSSTWGNPVNPYTANGDIMVVKLDPDGNLLWNTFLGGPQLDSGWNIAVDASGNAYVTGFSFAGWGKPVRPYSEGIDAFVAKLDSNGVLQWNTFLGTACFVQYVCDDYGTGVTVDLAGSVLVSGFSQWTWGNPINPFNGQAADAFVARLNSDGGLMWNTFLGGTDDDIAMRMRTGANGKIYITGMSDATWGNPVHPFTGNRDAFVVQLDPGGTPDWVSFVGGSGYDGGIDLALDSMGDIYIAGESDSSWGNSPRAFVGPYDNYAAKLDKTGHFLWNLFLGPTRSTGGDFMGITVDSNDRVAVTGVSGATWGSPLNPFAGETDAFVAGLSPDGALQWNTFLGGSGADQGTDIVALGNQIAIAGSAGATWGAPKLPFTANSDAFVAVLDLPVPVDTTTTLTSSVNPSVLGQTVTLTATVQAASGDVPPTGTVTFYEQISGNGASRAKLGTMQLATSNTFTWSASSLTVGTHNIVAEYSGDTNYNPSRSNVLAQVVNPAQMPTRVSLTSSPNPSIVGQGVTLYGDVDTDSVDRFPSGDIVLYEIINGPSQTKREVARTAGPRTTGISAIWRLPSLSLGTHRFIVAYSGDDYFAPGVSPVLVQQVVEKRVESTDLALQWNGWRGKQAAGASGGTYRMSMATGDSVIYRFSGTAITWVSYAGPNQGKAALVLDGISRGLVDLYKPQPAWQIEKTYSGLDNKDHVLTIKVSGQKNPASTGLWVTVDAFRTNGKTMEENLPPVQYSGWIGTWSGPYPYEGNYRIASRAGNRVALTFKGTSIRWVTAFCKSCGKATVYIDGIKRGTYDLYRQYAIWPAEIPFSGLGNNLHTIEIRVLGLKNPLATGTQVVMDGFRGEFVLP